MVFECLVCLQNKLATKISLYYLALAGVVFSSKLSNSEEQTLTHCVRGLGRGIAQMGALLQAHWQGLHQSLSISCGYIFFSRLGHKMPTPMVNIVVNLTRSRVTQETNLHNACEVFYRLGYLRWGDTP